MPTKYTRKGNVNRGEWTLEQLSAAIRVIDKGEMKIREAGRAFGIPEGTLRRRRTKANFQTKNLGPLPVLGIKNEGKIVTHIKKLQKHGFAPTRSFVRSMAFELAEQLKLPHKFNRNSRKAGYPWLESFLRRNKDLCIRISEGVSSARALAMTKDNVASYFSLLESTLTDNELMNEPRRIFNIDETGLQLNNRPEHVIAAKGSKNVVSITSSEKGETISVIVCCNAEGLYIPPTCIFKGKNMKPEFQDGMPPGSLVYMSQKSAYVTSDIFFKWLKEQFVPRKPTGKVLLLLDGHSSHCNNVEMLEFAAENNIILFCLPSHSTQFLQPLDRGFFKSFKAYYYEACNLFLRANPGRRINRLQFGQLLATAWEKSATITNAVSSFKATGIIPFSPSAIPDYAYLIEEEPQTQTHVENFTQNNNLSANIGTIRGRSISPEPGCSYWSEQRTIIERSPSPQPGCSYWSKQRPSVERSKSPQPGEQDPTPGKMLDQISPVPVAQALQTVRKRGRQLASVLTSNAHILEKKQKSEAKEKTARKTNCNKKIPKKEKQINKNKMKKKWDPESSSDDEDEVKITYDDSSSCDDESNICVGCREEYNQTKKKEDWIQCVKCNRWLHEGCTKFQNFCDFCGKTSSKKIN